VHVPDSTFVNVTAFAKEMKRFDHCSMLYHMICSFSLNEVADATIEEACRCDRITFAERLDVW
jgi:hypothetical protein